MELSFTDETLAGSNNPASARDRGECAAAAPGRILFLDHTASLGGGEIAMLNLLRHLDRRRFDPVVVLFSDGPLVERLRDAGIETHVISAGDSVTHMRKDAIGIGTLMRLGVVFRSLQQTIRLRRFIRRHRIDLVHTNSLKADLIGGLAGRCARVPVMWYVHDRITDDYLPRSVVKAFRLLARFVPNFIVANSAATLETLRLRSKERTSTIYPGIDLRLNSPADPAAHLAGTPSVKPPLIGLVGRITRWKGQDVFLRAAAKVLERFPQAQFQIIGAALFAEQDYEREVLDLAATLEIEKSLHFLGFRNDVPELLAKLDVLVHASTTAEPFGQVIVEGMAAAKAVVATNGGGVPEVVVHDETGLLVPMGDATAMAAAICAILERPDLAKMMGQRGRQRVLEHFTVERAATRIAGIYAQLLQT